jgi:acyl-CoA thioesterase-1
MHIQRVRLAISPFCAVAVFMLAAIHASPSSAQIVALGASNVQGYGVSSSESFPVQLEAMLKAKGKSYSVANAGISGDTTAGIISRLNSAVPQGTRIVVLAIGGRNDVIRGGSVEQARANLSQITSQLSARGIRVINAMPYVRAALQKGMAQSDGIHLTAEGHRWVASQVAAQIR